mmetsp:Transcript_16687/g.38380  ORF Transcript_16687/g.38380 Transcript_16687/m.38380 type:complete len:168 (+) Transcript_16687:219-722(+)
MKVSAISLLALLSGANAVGFGSLRGEKGEAPLDGFACTIQGSISQDTCDATKSEDGSTCVWCSVASYGVCVSGDIAAQMEQTIPGLTCDDGGDDDDDDHRMPANRWQLPSQPSASVRPGVRQTIGGSLRESRPSGITRTELPPIAASHEPLLKRTDRTAAPKPTQST